MQPKLARFGELAEACTQRKKRIAADAGSLAHQSLAGTIQDSIQEEGKKVDHSQFIVAVIVAITKHGLGAWCSLLSCIEKTPYLDLEKILSSG